MSELVQLKLSPIFRTLGSDVRRFRDDVLTDAGSIMKRTEQASIRRLWYDTGRTLSSLQEQVTEDGNTKTYHLFPTATSDKGAPYPLFGEYGTGRRGAQTGRPAPAGYTYGRSQGMTARRYSRIAVETAVPLIERMSKARLDRFAQNMTR